MAELPPRKRVRDAAIMRALAHPTRSALLSFLTATGPHTASECAAAVDSTPSNCSWHLRQLAEYGLVERSDGEDGRERPWRAAQVGLDIGTPDDDAAVRGAQSALAAAMFAEEQLLLQRYLDRVEDLDGTWREATALSSYALRVTPGELSELRDAIDAMLRPYVATIRTGAPPDARSVQASVRGFLRLEADGKPSS